MTRKQLDKILDAGEIAAVPRRDWKALGRDFAQSEAHGTGVAGTLRIGRLGGILVAVEEADDKRLAVRPLASRKAARNFVKARLEAYDRLWDG